MLSSSLLLEAQAHSNESTADAQEDGFSPRIEAATQRLARAVRHAGRHGS